MGKRILRNGLMAGLLVLAGCNQAPPVEVDSDRIEQTLYWSRSLQDKRIAIEGYINFDNGADGKAIAVGPQLRTQPYGAGQELLKIDVDFGEKPNQISSPNMTTKPMFNGAPKGVPDVVTFDPSELSYHDAQGAAHPINHRVRAIGRVQYAVSVENDPRSPIGQRFLPFLTHVTLEAPPGS